MLKRLISLIPATALFPALCLLVACRDQPGVHPEPRKADFVQPAPRQKEESQPVLPPVQAEGKATRKNKPPGSPQVSSAGGIANGPALEKIDWGKETTAAEVIAMAKNGEIREIQWHVMPNILRAAASDGRIFYIRNENKGIDLRGILIKAGVEVGKRGIDFRHVF